MHELITIFHLNVMLLPFFLKMDNLKCVPVERSNKMNKQTDEGMNG